MLFVIGLLALAFLIPLAGSLRNSGRSRNHSDSFSLLVGTFAGLATIGLVSVWIAALRFSSPES